jgi:hypothetical protein
MPGWGTTKAAILRTTAMPMMRERCEGIADPVLRLRTLMEALSEKTAMPALLATLHSAVLSGGRSTHVDHLWAFCSAAILRTAT